MAKVKVSESVFYADLCFQAQQAVEKALKGLLIYFGYNPPHTHKIEVLINVIENIIPVEDYIKQSAKLTTYAVDTRYPSISYDIPKDDYDEAIKLTNECIDWVYIKNKRGRRKKIIIILLRPARYQLS